MPLIVRGARQVGKTFSIEEFGRKEFQNLLTINFEISPIYEECFETLDPHMIINQLELLSQKKIIPGGTLLFLDEIQLCPKALQALRYFKEKMPQMHVIAAGSLLEFAIQDENFSFPVGRVQFVKMYPLSFDEFLDACGDTSLRLELNRFGIDNPPPSAIHEYLLKRVKEYFTIGGMPAAVFAFITTQSYLEAKYTQRSLWDAYEADFGKYAKKTQHKHLKKIFSEMPKLIGSQVKYSRIDPEIPNPARDMKQAIELLKLAGLLQPVHSVSAGGIPLSMGLKENIFKLIFLDIGLVAQAMELDPFKASLMDGPIAEQFVGQEILANGDPSLETRLYFWIREKVTSTAEVDYVIAHKGNIIPIEVKAGKLGRLRSLNVFIQEKRSPLGIKISSEALSIDKNIISIPFYMMSQLARIIDTCLDERQSG